MKIGVFDSGVGGLSVVNAIKKALPDLEILYREDKDNLPYGSKTPDVLLKLVTPILESMIKDGCQVIVIACNTVTTTIIKKLRPRFKVPLLGMEPMVKPAAAITKTGVIAVCATPATLKSARYNWLKKTYAPKIKVLEPDCSDWTMMIEANQVESYKIDQRIGSVLAKGADVIVLGCTHYHWIEDEIKRAAGGRAQIIQPVEPVIAQLKRLLKAL